VALRCPYPDQQPGDLFRDRPGYGKADRSGLSVSGFRSEEVVQLLRAHYVRLALQEGVSQDQPEAWQVAVTGTPDLHDTIVVCTMAGVQVPKACLSATLVYQEPCAIIDQQ